MTIKDKELIRKRGRGTHRDTSRINDDVRGIGLSVDDNLANGIGIYLHRLNSFPVLIQPTYFAASMGFPRTQDRASDVCRIRLPPLPKEPSMRTRSGPDGHHIPIIEALIRLFYTYHAHPAALEEQTFLLCPLSFSIPCTPQKKCGIISTDVDRHRQSLFPTFYLSGHSYLSRKIMKEE
jgi:hypothetical protein